MSKLSKVAEAAEMTEELVREAVVLNTVLSANKRIREVLELASSVAVLEEDILDAYSQAVKSALELNEELGDLTVGDFTGELEIEDVTNAALVRLCPGVCLPNKDVHVNIMSLMENALGVLRNHMDIEEELEPQGTI